MKPPLSSVLSWACGVAVIQKPVTDAGCPAPSESGYMLMRGPADQRQPVGGTWGHRRELHGRAPPSPTSWILIPAVAQYLAAGEPPRASVSSPLEQRGCYPPEGLTRGRGLAPGTSSPSECQQHIGVDGSGDVQIICSPKSAAQEMGWAASPLAISLLCFLRAFIDPRPGTLKPFISSRHPPL